MGTAYQIDLLHPVRVLRMIDALIDGLVVNILPRLVDP